MKPTIFVTRPLPQPGLDRLAQYFEVSMNPDDRVLSKSEIIENLRGKDALLCLLTDTIDREVIESNPRTRVISNFAVGFNNVEVTAATARRIPVCNTPGVLTEATADLTWALILAVARRIVEADGYLRDGKFKGWGPLHFLGGDFSGRTLGIIGMGRIGLAVARRGRGFGLNIVYCEPAPVPHAETEFNARRVELTDLLRQSDYVSIHCPLTAETRHLIGAAELKLMKPTAYLINTARGPILDELALVEAMRANTIAGAALDVYENEPALTPGLSQLTNVVLVPHIASATIETRTKMSLIAAENAIAIMERNKPFSIVNPEVLD